MLFVHSIVVSFKLLEIHYIEEIFHVGITHIILLNKCLPVYDSQILFVVYKACFMQCGGFD